MSLTTPSSLLCIGHRGAMGYEPENTLLSIKKAMVLNSPWIEIDVYFVDGELIVIHDDRLERTTNGTGRVEEKTFEYIRSLDAGKGERIPTLHEVFELVDRKIGINIELKGKNTALPVSKFLAEYLRKGWDNDALLVSSFNHRELRFFRDLSPSIPLGVLLVELPEENAAFAQQLGAYSVNPCIDFIDEEFVLDAHRRNLRVYVFTVNEKEDIEKMRRLGVDGVFTNFPDRVLLKNT